MSDDSKRPPGRGSQKRPGARPVGAGRKGAPPGRPAGAGDAGKAKPGQRPGKPFMKPSGDPRPARETEARAIRPLRASIHHSDGAAQESERIAKRLARAGVASRRAAEEMIEAGRISLNGRVLTSPAINVTMADRIEIDGAPIPAIERTRLFLFNKPAGVVTTNRDPQGRQTIFDLLPASLPRLMTVGRLDINTEGLLLLTNDGGLSRMLELPSTGWLRRYRVRVHGKVDEAGLAELKEGMAVDGVYYGAVEAVLDRVQGSNAWLTVSLREGKNREVRNILGAIGLDVTRLIRISYGPFQLGELAEREIREIKGTTLREQLGDRLIEESGANFEAPVLKPFSPKVEAIRSQRPPQGDAARAPTNRKREREERRETALGKLQTRPSGRPRPADGNKSKAVGKPSAGGWQDKGAKGDAKGGPKGGKSDEQAQRTRGTHVWMAPGARPMGEKKAAAEAERTANRRYAGKPRPGGPKKPPRGK